MELQVNAGIVHDSVCKEKYLDEEGLGRDADLKTPGMKCR